MKTIIHVNQKLIKARAKGQLATLPPLSVKVGGGPARLGSTVEIKGPSIVLYRPLAPLSCGARAWIETDAQVVVDGRPVP